VLHHIVSYKKNELITVTQIYLNIYPWSDHMKKIDCCSHCSSRWNNRALGLFLINNTFLTMD